MSTSSSLEQQQHDGSAPPVETAAAVEAGEAVEVGEPGEYAESVETVETVESVEPAAVAAEPETSVAPAARTASVAAGTAARRPRYVLRGGFLSSELVTMFRRWRNRALLIALAAIPIALGIALRLTTTTDSGAGNGGGSGFITQVSNNGLFLVFVALTVTLPIFLPMALGVVAGDAISGEASQGTLRYLLVAPVGRGRLLLAKSAGVVVFCFVSSFVVALSAWLTGLALFPVGRVTLLSGDTVSYGHALVIAVLITVIVAVSLLGLAAIGMFVSTLTDTPVAAMAVTVGATILSGILQAIPQLSSIQPWLFTYQWTSFADLLRDPVYTANIVHNLWIQLVYVLVFGSAAWARFSGRDVLA